MTTNIDTENEKQPTETIILLEDEMEDFVGGERHFRASVLPEPYRSAPDLLEELQELATGPDFEKLLPATRRGILTTISKATGGN